MNRTHVTSSQIASIGHDTATNTLEIEFVNHNPARVASIYQYQNVTPEFYAAFMTAESIGSFFIHKIKPFVIEFPYRKIQ